MAAPTLAYLISLGCTAHVSCPRCASIRAVDLVSLAVGRGENTTVDRIKFVCRVHGEPGQLVVTGPGNALTGRPRLWPPE